MEWHRFERRLESIIETLASWNIMATLQDILATEQAIAADITRVAGIVSALEADKAALQKQVADLTAQLASQPAQTDIDAAAAASAANKTALDAIQPPAT